MSEFNRISIRRGTEGLRHSKGFWSGKDVLFNNDDSTIYMLAEKATTQDLLDTILGFIDVNLRDWVLWDMRRNVELAVKEKPPRFFFGIGDIPSLQRREWISGQGVSLIKILRCWQEDGKSHDELSKFLADEWIDAWKHNANIFPNLQHDTPGQLPLGKLLLVRWDTLDGLMPLETFLEDLWNLAAMNMSAERFVGAGVRTQELWSRKENFSKVLNGLHDEERKLLSKYGYGRYLDVEPRCTNVHAIFYAPVCASQAMLVLSERGLLLPPRNLGVEPGVRIGEIGWIKQPIERWFDSPEDACRFRNVLVGTNIRELEDIPLDLRSLWGYNMKTPKLRPLRKMLLEYGKENNLPTFDVSSLERGMSMRVDGEKKKWRPQWFRDNGYSEAWCNFADASFSNSKAGVGVVADQMKSLCQWALEHFESPWDITPSNLIDPHNPKNPDTFAAFCKRRLSTGGKEGKAPLTRWTSSASLFKRVTNAVSIPGYPWYLEAATNPFEKVKAPFRGNNRGRKTHRSRIATIIHEKMIEILLDIDEHGKPTFAWARTQFSYEDLSIDGTWCPSRWTALAILLLLPLRKKQARWLDQGLMDEKVFDPETLKMVENKHPLRNYTYEDGKSHLQRYGYPSGVIQQLADAFMGTSEHIGLFINTNKTQLWNPEKRIGYELPWPDGSELLASADDELRQHGWWLRRVYEVLAYQYRHVMEHDPYPEPVTFTDVRCDTEKVSSDNECAARMPRFVPLFRDTSDRKLVDRAGERRFAAMPMTDSKIDNAYVALCIETEARLRADGFDSVRLTLARAGKNAESGVCSRRPKFDIHCLRVAGISRLIESGIDPVIVQEFIAGHLTPAMTHHYLKMQPWHVREKIVEAIVNGDFKTAMETFAEKNAKGEWNRENTFVGVPRFREHVANLPEDFACFSIVKGGVCVMGGKGGGCNEGGVYERQGYGKDSVEVEFGPVQGGCGNCIYFRTAAFLLQEQTLVLNILLAELRAQAKERKDLRTKISDVTCKIDEIECATKKNRFMNDKSLLEARIEELNHDMVPRLTEWVNRYIMLKECESQVDELLNGKADTTALVAPFGDNIGLTYEDLKVSQEMTPDIGLIGRIVEGSRVMGAWGIVIPEDHARFLERGVDRLLRMNGSQHLLLDVPTSERVHGASIMFNALEDLIGAEAMQKALDSETPLALPESQRNDVNNFAAALVGAAQKGRLTIQNLLEEGKNCNLITDPREGDYRWAI